MPDNHLDRQIARTAGPYILGVTGFSEYHDNSAALVKNGRVVFAISEERLTRKKHDPSFPKNSIKAALSFEGIRLKDLDYVVSSWPKRSLIKAFIKPYLFGDVLRSFLTLLINANFSLIPFVQRAFSREKKAAAEEIANLKIPKEKITYIDHHQTHASSAYRNSGFKKCLTVTLDGFGSTIEGDIRSGSVWVCNEGKMREVESIPVEASLGLFYEAVTVALGFKPVDGEGKTMGLAAYGSPKKVFKEMRELSPRFENGKWVENPYWVETIFSVDLSYKDIFLKTRLGLKLADLIRKNSKEDVAAAAQKVLEGEAVAYFKYLGEKYKQSNYTTAGGVFFNVKMNKRIRELNFVKSFFTYPNAGDGGAAAGAALELYAQKFDKNQTLTKLDSAALGTEYSDDEIKETLERFKDKIIFSKLPDIATYVGEALTGGKVVGWFQGRSEWGPRALGQRSVLADPRDPQVKDRINKLMKKREWFMPFAPSVMVEHARDWLVDGEKSPFMTMAYDVANGKKKDIRAAIHIDNTARPNTVSKIQNPKYWKVIDVFYRKTGVPAILNTSFNKHGLPIVESPEDAVNHLLWGCVDELAIGDYLAKKI